MCLKIPSFATSYRELQIFNSVKFVSIQTNNNVFLTFTNLISLVNYFPSVYHNNLMTVCSSFYFVLPLLNNFPYFHMLLLISSHDCCLRKYPVCTNSVMRTCTSQMVLFLPMHNQNNIFVYHFMWFVLGANVGSSGSLQHNGWRGF